ncbi:MAG TPA: hypothetical protein VF662_00865 [Allosphingosinicella sp.]|jgi:hypothetical protein
MSILALLVTTLLIMTAPRSAHAQDWCASGNMQASEGPWIHLSRDAVSAVVEDRLTGALKRLQKRALVPVTHKDAEKLTGKRLPRPKGERYFLARAGIVGGPAVSIHEYLRNRPGAVSFWGALSSDRRKLLIVTEELTPRFPARRFAVVVRARPDIQAAASRCNSAD